MNQLLPYELAFVSGGRDYVPPENIEEEPFKAGLTLWGGYTNHFLMECVGIDITGNQVVYNKILGMAVLASIGIPLVVGLNTGLHFILAK